MKKPRSESPSLIGQRLVHQLAIALSVFCGGISTLPVQAQTLALSDLPLFLLESTPPNLVLSYDDSGSMMWAFLPDSIAGAGQHQHLAATKSFSYNKMYYDPRVSYRPGLDANGDSLGEANFNSAFTNIYNHGQESWYALPRPVTVDLRTNFRPIWNATIIGAWGAQYSGPAEPAYYFVRDNNLPGCTGADLDNRCYRKKRVTGHSGLSMSRPEHNYRRSKDERRNFANWYQYYSYRTLAGKTVLSRAFAPENISSELRVGHQTINRRGVRSGDPGPINSGGNPHVAQFTDTERAYFYKWLKNITINGGTPLLLATRAAGEHFKTTGRNSPYSETPGQNGADLVSCRVNAHVMLSDGYWNSGGQQNNIKRDEQTRTLPDGTLYNPNAGDHYIYRDSQSQVNLADVAFHYWATDLSNQANNVAPYFPSSSGDATQNYWNPVNDPATWQHMVNFNVAFGIAGRVPLTTEVYDALIDGDSFLNTANLNQTGWTNLSTSAEAKADDMYHAAINSRGQFYSASKPNALVDSLVSVMNSIASRESSAAAVALNSSSIAAGVGVFQSRFTTDNWTGDLQARPISDGSNNGTCNSAPVGSICAAAWSAAERNTVNSLFPNNKDRRKVFTSNPAAALGGRGMRFIWNDLTVEQKSLIQRDASVLVGKQRLQHMRGSKAQEHKGVYRTRSESRVGAIVHSAPRIVGNGFDQSGNYEALYPDDMESSGSTHQDFLCANASDTNGDQIIDSCSSGSIRNSRTPVAYVGSNDGMLHAYDARIGHNNGGKELFSYIPNAVIENLYKLTEPTFISGSYVDGNIASTDVFYSNQWHTILLGGLRTGGQAYYALDVTKPSLYNRQTSQAATQLARWEFSDDNTSGVADGMLGANGDQDLGFTYGAPHIVKVNYTAGGANTGRWVAIFGNGYNATFADGNQSTSGNAVIYVVDIETGLLIKKLDTGVGSLGKPNGISGIAPILNDTDYTVDYVYAGDLYGNLWKFDIGSDDLNRWGSAYTSAGKPTPLFTAIANGKVQPIQSTPQVSRHLQSGNLVYFGTGQYLEDADNLTNDQQSFYAVWDKDVCTVGGTTASCRDTDFTVARTHQLNSVSRANMLGQNVTIDANGIRETTSSVIDWSTDFGWYLDFPANNGERAIGKPVLRGEIVIFTTVEPDDNLCEAGGGSWLYALDRVDGGPPPVQVFDHNGDGEIDGSDYAGGVSSASHFDAIISDPTYVEGKNGMDFIIYGSSDLSSQGGGIGIGATPDTTIEGRVRWRQLN